jgi:hypothetical protein
MIAISNAHLLEAQFGRWPDFHRAEVSGIRLFAPHGRPAQLELDIEVVELFRDAGGVYRDRQRCLTTFLFTNVLGARMECLRSFRQEEGLGGLEFAEPGAGSPIPAADWGGRRYLVRLVPPAGVEEAPFLCDQVTILKVVSISRAI